MQSDVIRAMAQASLWPRCGPNTTAMLWKRLSPAEQENAELSMRVALSALAKEGWVVVPKQPTDAMITAGLAADRGFLTEGAILAGRYWAMIAARPVALSPSPAEPSSGVGE